MPRKMFLYTLYTLACIQQIYTDTYLELIQKTVILELDSRGILLKLVKYILRDHCNHRHNHKVVTIRSSSGHQVFTSAMTTALQC